MESLDLRRWDLSQEIPEHMPLLDRWLEEHGGGRPLEDVTALLIQHQLGNHFPQAMALLALGLAPERLYWLDVPYTSTEAVRRRLMGSGIPEKNFLAGGYRVLDPYAPYQRRRALDALRQFAEGCAGKLVVLDDGSYFIEAMACYRTLPLDVAIVEQTTRGLIKIEDDASLRAVARRVPIVNVARSDPKLTLEPPFIGRAVCEALGRMAGSLLEVTPQDRCLVLGLGAIGRQVAEFVGRDLGIARDRIYVHDIAPGRVKAARADGYPVWDRRDLDTRFRFVVGCSGRAAFRLGDHVYLEDGAVLASASSGSVELSREGFIDLADSSDFDDVEILRSGLDEDDCHSHLRFRFIDREAIFVNAGFPVNFDGRVNCVPAHYIQPTPTMMVAAAVQAAAAKRPGLLGLNRNFSRWVDREFRNLLGDEAAVLPPGPADGAPPGSRRAVRRRAPA